MSGFVFNEENKKKLDALIRRYPEGRKQAAATGALYLVMQQEGFVPDAALETLSGLLGVPAAYLRELRSFYGAFPAEPSGKIRVAFCRGVCCGLRDAEQVREACCAYMGIGVGETRADGLFSAEERDCLGACVNAPVMSVNGVYHERLTPETAVEILKKYESEAK